MAAQEHLKKERKPEGNLAICSWAAGCERGCCGVDKVLVHYITPAAIKQRATFSSEQVTSSFPAPASPEPIKWFAYQ